MPYYIVDIKKIDAQKTMHELGMANVDTVMDTKNDIQYIKSDKTLTLSSGVSKITKSDYEGFIKTQYEPAVNEGSRLEVLPGMAELEKLGDWQVEQYSTREGILHQTAITPGLLALRIGFGGGRGDTIYAGRPLSLPDGAKSIRFGAYACPEGDDPVSMGVVFTTKRERPWLENQPVELPKNSWTEMVFDLTGLKSEKILKADKLILSVVTEADDGFVLVDQIKIKG